MRAEPSPYQANPALAQADNGTRVLVDGSRVAQGIAAEMDDPRALPLLPSAIAHPRSALLDRLLADGVILYDNGLLAPDYPWGAVLSGECSYDVHTVSQAHQLISDTRLELSGVDESAKFDCGAWKVGALPAAAFNATLGADAPTLIVQGALAPFSSVAWGPQLARETFSNSSVATFATLGSINPANQPRCLADARRQLIAERRLPGAIDGCAAESRPIAFVTGAG